MRYLGFTLLVLLMLSGCTANIGYQFADTLVEWRVKEYVELNSEQEETLAKKVDELHLWHARTQIPKYREALFNLRQKVNNKTLEKSDIVEFERTLLGFWQNLLDRAAAETALINQLSVTQKQQLVERIEEKQQDRFEKFEEKQSENPILRQLERANEVESDLEDIIGDLTEQQDKLLRDWVSNSPSIQEDWLNYRAMWLTEFETVLLTEPTDINKLSALIQNPKQLRSEALQEKIEQSSDARNTFLWNMYVSLSDKQRKAAVAKADEYIDLLDDITEDFKG
ncbi:hypothetical protein CEW91_06485 [Idiomarina piscisalsi]|uniref:Lipoprotein n=1 Tax=Idiomarina piscisalsi TaxID=1096243 RepID=A0ABM6LT70_9GAMM|nr:DUF6279 family lipoprotein [Idiomarina piscisalsi]ASG65807.1 hypothetical protein CEW91_06485 [Idiomarina piscisalsi]